MDYYKSTRNFKNWRSTLHLSALIICFCLCIIGIYAANCNNTNLPSETRFMIEKAANYFQKIERNEMWEMMAKGVVRGRRLLGGPGSSPPRCNWKCGRCTPCRAVHVVVPPGMRVTAEYYAEAWRCKCGNHLYMP